MVESNSPIPDTAPAAEKDRQDREALAKRTQEDQQRRQQQERSS